MRRLLSVKDVKIQDMFWSQKINTYITRTIPHSWKYVVNDLRALRAAADGNAEGDLNETGADVYKINETWTEADVHKPNGTWSEANIGKLMETIAYALAIRPDEELRKKAEAVIDMVRRAQQPDGFVHAYATNQKRAAWAEEALPGGHDGYVQGHMIEAAVEYHLATGDAGFLEIAKKAADCACNRFLGPNGKPGFCGHSEMELALVELYRVTGVKRYLELAKAFIEWHGTTISLNFTAYTQAYAQNHRHFTGQKALDGHAVRALFFAIGVADVAIETGDAEYRNAANRFWDCVAWRRLYITGSTGPRHACEGEAMGEDYELPQNGYNESCAACALADFAQRMFLLEGRSEYADVLERVLYNAVLHGMALDGCHSYDKNPMDDGNRPRDNNWCCCPPNLSRTLLQVGRYAYAQDDRNAFVNLYVGGEAAFDFKGGRVALQVQTDYPRSGAVHMTVRAPHKARFALNLRQPGWCDGMTVKLNGRALKQPHPRTTGFVVLDRAWQDGDTVMIDMPMPVRRTLAHPNVEACRGKVAIERGPIVYALEGLDNAGHVDIELGKDPGFEVAHRSDLLGGATIVTGKDAGGMPFTALPYHLLANREPSCQKVWIRQQGLLPPFDKREHWWLGQLYRPLTEAFLVS